MLVIRVGRVLMMGDGCRGGSEGGAVGMAG